MTSPTSSSLDALVSPQYIESVPTPVAKRVYFVAEIGINHNGSVDLAKKLIDMAKETGCDAVKFQKRSIDIVYSPEVLNQPRESPWGTTQRAQKEGLEFGEKEYNEIDAYCRKVGIDWFFSAWDIESQKFMRRYDVKLNKIASAMLTNLPFLELVAAERKPTLISTGMCEWPQIDTAVEVFRKHKCPIVLMHTLSTYPSPEEELNLSVIHALRKRYGLPVGYSGHEPSVSPSVIAAMMGAVAIERHITLNRSMYGSDQAASLESAGLRSLLVRLRQIPVVVGDGVKRFDKAEQGVAKKLRYWEN